MLSFEVVNEGRSIQIHCDSRGMGVLIGALARLMEERGGHTHLKPPLLNEMSPYGDPTIAEVIIGYMESDPLEEV